jgi:hypothetical protein
MKLSVTWCLTALTLFAQVSASAADTLSLTAEAGLGGIGKAGRWSPVRVSVENTGQDLAGELVVGWGDSTVHRSVVLASPSRRRFDVYIRTSDVRGSITVQLRSNGVDLRSVNVPMRAMSSDAEVTLCVTSAASDATDTAECTTRMTAAALPRSMRGYDAIDRVRWRAGSDRVLDADQRVALARWREYRQLEETGVLSLSPRVPSAAAGVPPRASLNTVAIGTAVYGLVLIVVGSMARRSRRQPLPVYAVIGVIAALGSSVGIAAGHVGPASAVLVRYASTVQQLPGGGSLLSMQGFAEYPAFDSFQIRAALTDAELELKSNPRSESWFDDSGYPVLSGVSGLGTSQEFALEGVVALSPLEIERRSQVIRVRNASSFDLRDCRFPEGFSVQRVGTLRPGQTVEATELEAIEAPFFACTLSETPVDFTDVRYPVRIDGSSLVTAYLPPDSATGPSAR